MPKQLHLFCALTSCALWLLGCDVLHAEADKQITLIPPNKDKVVIKWDGPFKLDAANYYIDGKGVGAGLKGFDQVMKYLSLLNRSAQVTIESPKAWLERQMDGVIYEFWEFPFEGFSEQEKAFSRLSGEKSFVILFKTTPEQKK